MTVHKQKSITIQDVATSAGVSIATASRVLSRSSYPVSLENREKVLRAAKQLHYTPNMLGKMLQSSKNTSIGVIVPTLQNPYFYQVIMGIEAEARKHNYEVIISSSHRSVAQERDNIHSLLEKRVMGLVAISLDESPTTLNQYIEYGGHVALLEADFHLENAVRAKVDYCQAGRMAAQYLVDLGHRRIAFVSSPLTKVYRREIMAGIREIFLANGVSFTTDDMYVAVRESESDSGMYEFDTGKELMLELLAKYPKKYSAVIAVNDITAFGMMQALLQSGISIPGEMSIISFDNIPYSNMVSPPLTTIALPSASIGSSACHFLINLLEEPAATSDNISFSFSCTVEERESVRNLS